MVNTRRYWDGSAWTTHRAPVDPQPGLKDGAVTEQRDQTGYAWTLVVLPLALAAIYVAIPEAAGAWGITLVYWAMAIGLGSLDLKGLQALGIDIGGATLLLIPLYLIDRTRQARSTPLIPLAWFATFGLSLLVATAVA